MYQKVAKIILGGTQENQNTENSTCRIDGRNNVWEIFKKTAYTTSKNLSEKINTGKT